ncbi:uncharacterized protein LOC126735437 isoform X2 [Anthonomus grandis grandis]|uniref:uncharacterized protein LOC126735437 isoform X2 n=1 Tax=Anthonomus grandis grandis TaxID=2921223 RepID=UPI002166481F|nr:uncharacterized protein LOC126735437 isoform X2 [Anthonomus grandis grandis]
MAPRKGAKGKNELDEDETLPRIQNLESANPSTILEIELRLKEIETKLLTEFSEIHFELEGLDPDNFTEQDLNNFETLYFKTIADIKQFLSIKTTSSDQQVIHDESIHSLPPYITSLQRQVSVKRQNTKLPVIELPKFSGQYDKWLEFRDLYTSLVHKNNCLEPIEKFQYLKATLEGAAAQSIQAINITNENYDLAWDILCQRFENKRLIVHNHIKSLFNIYDIRPDSANSFRNVLDIISKNMRSLNNLGVITNSSDPLIIYLVTSKLDVESIREWEQSGFAEELPSLAELYEFLSSRADFLDKVAMHKGKPRKTFIVNQPSTHQSSNLCCFYCKQQHAIYHCPKFTALSVDQRWSAIKSQKLCVNCLRSGHKLDKCRYGHCRHCKQRHNSLLHKQQPLIPVEDGHLVSSKETTQGQVALYNSTKSQILLATAVVQVFDIHGKGHSCRALLDNASMSNFVSQDFVNK